jgi:hypothetical protein
MLVSFKERYWANCQITYHALLPACNSFGRGSWLMVGVGPTANGRAPCTTPEPKALKYVQENNSHLVIPHTLYFF